MEAIRVPPPSRSAFNKNRPISDLIRAQINHLKHLEEKLTADVRQQIPQHAIVSEDDAAQYIAAMTRLFRSQATTGAATVQAAPRAARKPIPIRTAQGLDIAAAGKKSKTAAKTKAARSGRPQSARKEKKR